MTVSASTAVVCARHNPGVTCAITTMSLSGVYIFGSLTLAPGERVAILLELDGHPFEVVGEVIRSEPADFANDRSALRFVALDPAQRALLLGFVSSLPDELLPGAGICAEVDP